MTKVEGQGLLRWSRRTWDESTRAVHKKLAGWAWTKLVCFRAGTSVGVSETWVP